MLYWIECVWSSKECVCCACDPSVHLDVSFIGCVYVCGSQVFALFMMFLCDILLRACSCCASYHFVYCVCMPSE